MKQKVAKGQKVSLGLLSLGQSGKILDVKASDEIFLHRLWDMGITKGTSVEIKSKAPLGDPITLELRGYMLCVRKEDIKDIVVEVTA